MNKIPDYGLSENYASFAEIQQEITALNLGTTSTKTAGTLAGVELFQLYRTGSTVKIRTI